MIGRLVRGRQAVLPELNGFSRTNLIASRVLPGLGTTGMLCVRCLHDRLERNWPCHVPVMQIARPLLEQTGPTATNVDAHTPGPPLYRVCDGLKDVTCSRSGLERPPRHLFLIR